MRMERGEMEKVAKVFFEDLFISQSEACKINHIFSRVERCIIEKANLSLTTIYMVKEGFERFERYGSDKGIRD